MNMLITLLLSLASVALPAQQPAEKAIPDKVRLFIPYKDYPAEDNKRILELYKYLRVADVSDGMDVVGLQDVGLVDPEIHALWKDTEKFTHRVVGVAVTARYVPTNKREPKMDDQTIGRWYRSCHGSAAAAIVRASSVRPVSSVLRIVPAKRQTHSFPATPVPPSRRKP